MGKEHTHDDDWMEEAPLLASIRGSLPQEEVPEGYFDAFPARMMERIRAEEANPKPESEEQPAELEAPLRAPGRKRPSWRVWGIAASVVLLAGLGIIFLGRPSTVSDEAFEAQIQAQLTSLDDDQILDHLDLGNVSEQELYEALGQEAQASLGEELHGMGQQQMLDYLDDLDLDAIDLEGLEIDDEFLNDSELF